MTVDDSPSTLELASTDGDHSQAWSADLADAEFARLLKGTKVVTPVTRILLAIVLAAIGFIAGVLVQRSQQPATAIAATSGAQRNGNANSTNGGGGTAAGGTATIGTITLIDGTNLYITTTQGDVVKVTTNPQTTISVSRTGTLADLDQSKTVVVQGTTNADGTVTASQISQGGFGIPGGRRNGGTGGTTGGTSSSGQRGAAGGD